MSGCSIWLEGVNTASASTPEAAAPLGRPMAPNYLRARRRPFVRMCIANPPMGPARVKWSFIPTKSRHPDDWSRDGRFLIFTLREKDEDNDLWVLPLEGDRKPMPYLVIAFVKRRRSFLLMGTGWSTPRTNPEPGKSMCSRFLCRPAGNGLYQMAEAASHAGRNEAKNCFISRRTDSHGGERFYHGRNMSNGIPKALFHARSWAEPAVGPPRPGVRTSLSMASAS